MRLVFLDSKPLGMIASPGRNPMPPAVDNG